ncbi:MAG: L-dopachrome tautomerase-related protein [Ostreibacterium sp.]
MKKFINKISMIIFFTLTLLSWNNIALAREKTLLTVAQNNHFVWNAVAVQQGRIFVSGPRWLNPKGPSVALIKGDKIQPYPSAEWNSWKAGDDPSKTLISVNAIHLDPNGNLWVVDTGSPTFGANPITKGAKLLKINLSTNKVEDIFIFDKKTALSGSYIDDIRFNGSYAYLTDAGRPGIIVINLVSREVRRVLNDHFSTKAPEDRDIVVDGKVLTTNDGKPLRVNSDPLEVSPDGKWLYYASLQGPWFRIETHFLDDFSLSSDKIEPHVKKWIDLPPVGGTTMDRNGNLYFAELATNSLKLRRHDGSISTIIQDKKLHWIDAPFLDGFGFIWLPIPQIDRAALFNHGVSKIQQPIKLFKLDISPVK